MRDDGATDETLAAPSTGPKLAHGTTRGSDPTVSANVVGQVTRASSPSLAQTMSPEPVDHDALPVVDRANYQIIGELARGGMGRILEARDLRLGRPIAIKEVLHADEGARARFDREVRITAGLQHPAIVHVTEAGQWPSGQPFFAMKLIRGKPLDARIAESNSLTERLALLPAVIAVTDALAYAHSKSVIHRDLKPANVLVGDFGETVVIDWGIAKDLSETEEIVSLTPAVKPVQLASSVAETVAGSVMGTPSYMPPEQASGERVDARADVYALGAMLYQVLAGVPPFVGRSTAEVLAKVLEGAPEPLATIVPDAPVDLIAVVEKAMARNPADRFPTANEMVAELKRFQQGKLVASHAYTRWQLTKRWLSRNRGAVLVGIVAFAAMVIVAGLFVWKVFDEKRATAVEAMAARAQADTVTIRDAQNALALDPTAAVAILKRLSLDTTETRAARMIASEAASIGVAHVLAGEGPIQELAFSPDGDTLVSYDGKRLVIWELATWSGREIGTASDELMAIAFAKDGIRGFDVKGQIWTWSSTTPGKPRLERTLTGTWNSAQLSPDGMRLAAEVIADDGRRGETRIYDLHTDDRLICECRHAVWTADGRAVLAHQPDGKGSVVRFDVATGELTTIFEGAFVPSLGGDGSHTWIARDSSSFRAGDQTFVRDLGTGRRVALGVEAVLLAPLPGGRVVVSTSRPAGVSSWESMHTEQKGQLVAFNPDVVSSGDHSLIVSDGWPGNTTKLVGHAAPVIALAVSTRGVIASGDSKGSIRVWTLPVVNREHDDASSTIAAVAGSQLVIGRFGPRLEVRDLATGTKRMLEITDVPAGITIEKGDGEGVQRIGDRIVRDSREWGPAEIVELAVSADHKRIVTLDTSKHAVVWDLARNRGSVIAGDAVHVAIDHDGSKIATAREHGANPRRWIEEWDLATGTNRKLGEMVALAMQYGPGDRLAIATDLSSAFVYEADKAPVRIHVDDRDAYRAILFSADGKTLYLGSDNWSILVYELETGRSRVLNGHLGTVVTLALSPDGKRLFSGSADTTVREWNLADGSSTVLRGHKALVSGIELGDAATMITSSLDGTARIWDLATGFSRPLQGHADRVLFARQLPGAQRVVTVDRAHQVSEYSDTLPSDPVLLRAWLDAATNLAK